MDTMITPSSLTAGGHDVVDTATGCTRAPVTRRSPHDHRTRALRPELLDLGLGGPALVEASSECPDLGIQLCRSETSWANREIPGTWREHPKPPARAVEC